MIHIMSSASPPGDAPLSPQNPPSSPLSTLLSLDSSDTAPVLPPLNLSFDTSSGLDLGEVDGHLNNGILPLPPPPPPSLLSSPSLNTDAAVNGNVGDIRSPTMNVGIPPPVSPPLANSHLPRHSSASSPSSSPSPVSPSSGLRSIPIPIPVSILSNTPASTLHGVLMNQQFGNGNTTGSFVMMTSKPDLGVGQGQEQGCNGVGFGTGPPGVETDSLPPEVTKADLFIAPDGSFVQTSSALAARELKKCYDKILRVGHRDQVVRSPYAITAVEDETGAKVFRISRRDDDPTLLASDHSLAQTQSQTQGNNQSIANTSATTTTSLRRKARLSVQDFLPSGMFKPNNNTATVGSTTNSINQIPGNGSISFSPTTNQSPSSPPPITRRKLRKTRSNSDLHSRVTLSPSNSTDTHSQTSSQQQQHPHHAYRYTHAYDTYSLHPAFEIRDELTAGADAFSQVLGWVSELATDIGAIASSRRKGKSISGALMGIPVLVGNTDDGYTQANTINTHNEAESISVSTPVSAASTRSRSSSAAGTGIASSQNDTANFPRRPSVSTSAALSNFSATNNAMISGLHSSANSHIFGEAWHNSASSPFGENVKYTTPLRVSSNGNLGNLGSDSVMGAEESSPMENDSLSQPPQIRELREMQSFESGLTARIGDNGSGNGRERHTAYFYSDTGLNGIALPDPDTPKFAKEDIESSLNDFLGHYTLPSDSNSSSNTWLHFSTRVFDVIQTYKGLPLPSALLSAPPTGATIKITAAESPNPKDDPRFVIWGEVYGDSGNTNTASRDDASMSVSVSGVSQTESSVQSPHTHSTSSAAPLPPRKRSNARQPDQLYAVNSEATPRTVVIAATIERWIAQLTSELDYDELLNFLLTYRTYITSVDLCHLLICRFHWALEKPASKQDEMIRRIIRVRTFNAIRYWLLTFFREDFLSNSALCTLFTTWLNNLFRDLNAKNYGGDDALGIVRKLRKVVRECKTAHFRNRTGTEVVANPTEPVTDDSDVDLDFSNIRYAYEPIYFTGIESESGNMPSYSGAGIGLSFDAAAKFGVHSTMSTKTNPTTLAALTASQVPLASPNTLFLSQPLSKTILYHVKSPKPGTDAPLAQATGIETLPLLSRSAAPYHSSAISRAFVNTIGRLGRWKRVLNVRDTRSSTVIGSVPYDANMSVGYVSQLEARSLSSEYALHTFSGTTRNIGAGMASPAEALLHVEGGVEEYLKMLKLGPSSTEAGSNASGTMVSKENVLAPAHSGAEEFKVDADSESTNNNSVHDSHEDDDGQPFPSRPPGLEIPSPSHTSVSESFSTGSNKTRTHSIIESLSASSGVINSPLESEMDRRTTFGSRTSSISILASSYPGPEQGDSEGSGGEGSMQEQRTSGSTRLHKGRTDWMPDVVSLDDYDLSTSDSDLSSGDNQNQNQKDSIEDAGVGVGIRKGKTLRRLPHRHEFQFVRGSGGSVSSLGLPSQSSFVMNMQSRSGSRERENERIESAIFSVAAGRHSPSTRPSSPSSLSSTQRTTSQASTSHADGGGYATHFHQWQIELISDEEEEAGDAEAALRRLEGQIDVERQREKDLKVGRWLRTARAKAREGIDFSAEGSGRRRVGERKYSVSAESVGSTSIRSGKSLSLQSVNDKNRGEEDDEGEERLPVNLNTAVTITPTAASTQYGNVNSNGQERDRSGSVSSTASVSISSSGGYANSGAASMSNSANATYSRTSIIGTRRPSDISSLGTDTNTNNSNFKSPSVSSATPGSAHAPSAPVSGPGSTLPYGYRSFLLLHRSESLAQQFMIIEADLFKKIKFEEIITHQWGQALEDVNVRDWVSFVKERAKLKNANIISKDPNPASDEGTHGHSTSMIRTTSHPKLSSILALRARFDLIVNFVASEVVLAHQAERVVLVEKIIRIAWKMYLHNNFNTLVAVVSGLQTRWVNKAMGKKWGKVGMWEQRIFEDLKRFASREGEFKYIRNATAALIDQRPLRSGTVGNGAISSPSVADNSLDGDKDLPQGHLSHQQQQQEPYCLPFLGAYLAQLYAYEKLPDFIDPTAPTEPVLIDMATGNLSPPSHPEVFFNLQPLPEDITLEPLINVHKQRLIAGVIKAFVGAQHLAAFVPFGVDEKSYQKCLRIRSLETDMLQSLLGREVGTH